MGFFETGYTIASGFYKKYRFFLKESNRLKTTPHTVQKQQKTYYVPYLYLAMS